jgi:DNA-binding transcriptional LysR family regulator
MNKRGLKFERTVHSSNLEVIRTLVVSGAGVGILPERVANRLKDIELKPIADSPKFVDKHCLVYRADVQKSQASRTISRSIEKAVKAAFKS